MWLLFEWTRAVLQRKPEESPVKEGVSKKVKQDNGHTNGEQEPQTDGGEAGEHTNSMEVKRYELQC